MVATGLVAVSVRQDSRVNETTTRQLVGAVAMSAALAGCSSSGPSPAAPASRAPSGAASTAAADAAQTCSVDAVNALCDALLPKIITVTHGGSIDVPAHEYLATWPAHKRLLDEFDAQVDAVSRPTAASGKARTLISYVRLADELDAARLAAARKGEAAYAKEVRTESAAENRPPSLRSLPPASTTPAPRGDRPADRYAPSSGTPAMHSIRTPSGSVRYTTSTPPASAV